jgi:hypothetical protein
VQHHQQALLSAIPSANVATKQQSFSGSHVRNNNFTFRGRGVAIPPFIVKVISKLLLVQITTTLIFGVSSVINLAILRLDALRDLTVSFFLNLFDQILKPTLPPTNTFSTHWSKNGMPTLELHTI